jgi:hypothetical protein
MGIDCGWAWFGGPWMVQAEPLAVEQESGGVTEDVSLTGFYVEVARALTGEDLNFGGVDSPSDSWVAALRLSTLQISDELGTVGFLGPGTPLIDSIVPSSHMIVRYAWTHSWYGEEVPGAGSSEGLLTAELQLHF